MAKTFTNQAMLSYNGNTTASNIVSGEIVGTLNATKKAVINTFFNNEDVTYVISITNSGSSAISNLTLTDDLAAFQFTPAPQTEGEVTTPITLYPMKYTETSALYYVNGESRVLPSQITVKEPLTITGISVPAGGNVTIIYEVDITEFARLDPTTKYKNTVTISGEGRESVTAEETITVEELADLSISKSVSPSTIPSSGTVVFTFVIQNSGNKAVEDTATDTADLVISDIFDSQITIPDDGVKLNGVAFPKNNGEAVNWTYTAGTGEFKTMPGVVTVPAAKFTIKPDTGETITHPGVTILEITGNA